MMRSTRLLPVLLTITMIACREYPVHIRGPASRPPTVQTTELQAGFARVDITPAAGGGLMGYGPEGARAQGHRMRLYARVMFLEDGRGERLAFVVADLGGVSALLQRRVATLIHPQTGIGADRLLLSATHTHSGPSHFFGHPAHDEQASSVEGYDSVFTEVMASRIARAVVTAWAARRSARAAWGRTMIWGQTRVRNDVAVARNQPRFLHPSVNQQPVPNDSRYRHIDPQLTMLRVDVRDASGNWQPAGSFSIFPVHGTMNSGANQLIDGDLHTIVTRELERGSPARAAVHLLANGAEGDIVADFSPDSRCPAPAPRPSFGPTGPRRPPAPDLLAPVSKPAHPQCMSIGRNDAQAIGLRIAGAMAALHKELERALAAPGASRLSLARNYGVLSWRPNQPGELCKPSVGPATLSGVEGGFTRILNLELSALLGVDTIASPPKPAPQERCQGVKPSMTAFERMVAGLQPYPFDLQLSVVRVGDVVIGTVPGEATTNAGARMRRALAPDSAADPLSIYDRHIILGLANGYVQYITTEAEYGAQLYEGASTLFGPRTTEAIAGTLHRLAAGLRSTDASPSVEVPDLSGRHRGNKAIVPRRSALPPPPLRRELHTCFRGDTLFVRWNDRAPGDLDPAEGALLRIEGQGGLEPRFSTWDDDPFLEVWYLGKRSRRPAWEARFAPPHWTSDQYRAVLMARGNLVEEVGDWIRPDVNRCP